MIRLPIDHWIYKIARLPIDHWIYKIARLPIGQLNHSLI